MNIELLLQERIDRVVEIERKARGTIDAEAPVDIETAWALDKRSILLRLSLKGFASPGA